MQSKVYNSQCFFKLTLICSIVITLYVFFLLNTNDYLSLLKINGTGLYSYFLADQSSNNQFQLDAQTKVVPLSLLEKTRLINKMLEELRLGWLFSNIFTSCVLKINFF